MVNSTREILENLGYKLISCSNGWRTNRKYANGDNYTALSISKEGKWYDFVDGRGGDLRQLIQLTLGLKDVKDTEEWLQIKNVNIIKIEEEPKLEETQILPIEWLNYLKPDHSYWMNRGISEGVMAEFKGGVAIEQIPRMKERYCFPVIDCQNRLIGLTGRLLRDDQNKPKWKLLGQKKYWKYPLFINHDYITETKQVVLVESIGNCLALWNAGCKNVIVMFGVDLSFEIINYLLKFDIYKVIISTDNDSQAGLIAAPKIYKKLSKYFDKKWLKIIHPIKKDFGEQTLEENQKWLLNANVLPK